MARAPVRVGRARGARAPVRGGWRLGARRRRGCRSCTQPPDRLRVGGGAGRAWPAAGGGRGRSTPPAGGGDPAARGAAEVYARRRAASRPRRGPPPAPRACCVNARRWHPVHRRLAGARRRRNGRARHAATDRAGGDGGGCLDAASRRAEGGRGVSPTPAGRRWEAGRGVVGPYQTTRGECRAFLACRDRTAPQVSAARGGRDADTSGRRRPPGHPTCRASLWLLPGGRGGCWNVRGAAHRTLSHSLWTERSSATGVIVGGKHRGAPGQTGRTPTGSRGPRLLCPGRRGPRGARTGRRPGSLARFCHASSRCRRRPTGRRVQAATLPTHRGRGPRGPADAAPAQRGGGLEPRATRRGGCQRRGFFTARGGAAHLGPR